jgi:ribonuclease HI
VLLQELKQVTPSVAYRFAEDLKDYKLFHNASGTTNGVGILVHSTLLHLMGQSTPIMDSHSRCITITVGNVRVSSCYGSNVKSQREEFLKHLCSVLDTPYTHIFGGDLNLVYRASDRQGQKTTEVCTPFADMMKKYHLADCALQNLVQSHLMPPSHAFPYHTRIKGYPGSSRLDYVCYMQTPNLLHTHTTYHDWGHDHVLVCSSFTTTLNLPPVDPPTPPARTLQMSKWTSAIYKEFTQELQYHERFYSYTRDRWHLLHHNEKHHRVASLLTHMVRARDFLARRHNTFRYPNRMAFNLLHCPSPTAEQLEKHQTYLQQQHDNLYKKHMKAFFKGDTSFLPQTRIPCTASTESLVEHLTHFGHQARGDPNLLQEFLDYMPDIPTPPPDFDFFPTFEEFQHILHKHQGKDNKSPGPDTLHKKLFQYLPVDAQFVLYMYLMDLLKGNLEWEDNILNTYIVLLYKGEGDSSLPPSFRPIALANSITKFFAYVARHSITKLLAYYTGLDVNIIPLGQAGFQTQQSTTDHVYTLQHLINLFPRASTLFVDLFKAFDSVDLHILQSLLEKIHVPACIAQSIFHMQSYTHIQLKGREGFGWHRKDPFKGMLQGCPLSPLLCCIYLAPLLHALSHHTRLPLQCCSPAASDVVSVAAAHPAAAVSSSGTLGFADDIAVEVTQDTAPVVIHILTRYELVFGVLINMKKTKLLPHSDAAPCNVTLRGTQVMVVTCFKYLGACVSNTSGESHAHNIIKEELNAKIQRLSTQPLQMLHRIKMVNITLIPMLIHRLQFFSYTSTAVSTVDETLKHYVKQAHDAPKSVPDSVLYASRTAGGFQLHKLTWALVHWHLIHYTRWAQGIGNHYTVQTFQHTARMQCENMPAYHLLRATLAQLPQISSAHTQTDPAQAPVVVPLPAFLTLPFATAYTLDANPKPLPPPAPHIMSRLQHHNPAISYTLLSKPHVFYTDGSLVRSHAGAGLSIRSRTQININSDLVIKFSGIQTPGRGELVAIAMALALMSHYHLMPEECCIITDYKPFLTHMSQFPLVPKKASCGLIHLDVFQFIYQRVALLPCRVDSLVIWCKSHAGLPGNEHVDAVAKHATTLPSIQYQTLTTLDFHVCGQPLSKPLLTTLIPTLRPTPQTSHTVHRKLSYYTINTPNIAYHAWRSGLFNMPGFEGNMCGRQAKVCQACNNTHPLDVYGALTLCPQLSPWRAQLLQTYPSSWRDTIRKLTGWPDHTHATQTLPNLSQGVELSFSDQRNLVRHLMPVSLHSELLKAGVLHTQTVKEWETSLVAVVNLIKSMPHDPSFSSIVPCPNLIKNPQDVAQNQALKRNRAISLGFPTAFDPNKKPKT